MISLFYSLLEYAAPNLSVKMKMLLSGSFYTWASGLWEAIPDFAIVDVVLGVLTVFHLFIAITFVSMADAFYKKPLMELHFKIVKPLFEIPLSVPISNFVLGLLAAQLSYRSYTNPNDHSATLRAVVATYTWVCCILLQKVSITLAKMGVDHCLKAEQEVERHDIRNWKTPPQWIGNLFAPLDWILRSEVHGADNIPTDYPGLYVMNHALLGLEMIPFVATVYRLKNVFVRGLTEKLMFGHLIGEFIRYFGGVNGTRDNCDVLMEQKDNVLVYPGGGYELLKPCAIPNYTLMWRQRLGFARVAIKHGYPIVPCASVGTEDMLDKLWDIDLGFVRKGLKCPVCIVQPHKLQKVYFWFGEPIPTSHYKGDYENDEFAKEVRAKAKAAIEAGIRELQERQANDPDRYLFQHMANACVKFCKDPFASTASSSDSEDNAPKQLEEINETDSDEGESLSNKKED